jgi:hypothetical protein
MSACGRRVGAKVAYYGRRWQVYVAPAFPLARILPRCVRLTSVAENRLTEGWAVRYAQNQD